MTTNSLYVGSLCIIASITLFVGGAMPGSVASVVGNATLEAPSVWNILTFSAGTFWAFLSFQVEGLHWVANFFFWCVLAVNLWCLVKLIRGVS